jgi:ABC-type Co2+ transport system permease subunit
LHNYYLINISQINSYFFLFYLYRMAMFNVAELVKRIVKYLIEGLMVAIAAFAIPKKSLNMEEIILLALTAAATFAILDTYIPSMGVSARTGAGFGIGANLVGFPGGL